MRSGLYVRGLDIMLRILRLVWLLLLLVLITGCRGCTSQEDSEKLTEKEKQKRKLRLVADELRTLPFSKEIVGNSVKPGHWYQTRQKLKATKSIATIERRVYGLKDLHLSSSATSR